MHLAEILSDLVSLRVCDPAAALALVSARPDPTTSASSKAERDESREEQEDGDLKRAKDLVELHYAVKEAHKRGELGRGLMDARASVDRAVGGV
ncbi:hypothetical protein BU26DRAFT_418669 [Trematosphaeria pertusa]|uniref:Uncharacterized protein n=1 Tax=Trematosphaeria pertusa TaxID=390896 RepID=A0A6A6IT20_9PLEO|nr:uncharacterized protein BU26DRAFT_418669 [Trematosphaeria pertusa]KAF2253449.1 hypothetical protein BU26DRAFT_418669 [Trematosphaeria pertusa]